jgi:hypothetical protein
MTIEDMQAENKRRAEELKMANRLLRDAVDRSPDMVRALRIVFGQAGSAFPFGQMQHVDAQVLALRAAKSDGEQAVISYLERISHHE